MSFTNQVSFVDGRSFRSSQGSASFTMDGKPLPNKCVKGDRLVALPGRLLHAPTLNFRSLSLRVCSSALVSSLCYLTLEASEQ